MDAKIFQEINAIKKLEQAQQAIQQAKQNYQQAQDTNSKQKALAAWQTGIDQLNQLPEHTVAKQHADTSYEAYLRDFSEVSGLVAGNNRANKIIAVAEQFHAKASDSCPDLFHPVSHWQQCANLLSKAIAIFAKLLSLVLSYNQIELNGLVINGLDHHELHYRQTKQIV